MKVLGTEHEGAKIRFASHHEAKGFYLLLDHGAVTALPHGTYVVGPEHLRLLDEAKVPYKVIGR